MGGNFLQNLTQPSSPQMNMSGMSMPLSQVDPNGLNQQERYAYQQAAAYAAMKHGGIPPEQALSPQAYQHYLGIMQQYFPDQNFYKR